MPIFIHNREIEAQKSLLRHRNGHRPTILQNSPIIQIKLRHRHKLKNVTDLLKHTENIISILIINLKNIKM